MFCIFTGENQTVTKTFDMTTGYKVTELFCIIDEFCKHFNAENAGNLLEDNSGVKRRRRQASLSDSEIMTILLYFYFGTFRNFKHYYLFFIKGTMKSYFPKAVILYKTLGYPELGYSYRIHTILANLFLNRYPYFPYELSIYFLELNKFYKEYYGSHYTRL